MNIRTTVAQRKEAINEPKDVIPQKSGSVSAYLRSLRAHAAKGIEPPRIVNELTKTKRKNELYVPMSFFISSHVTDP